VIPLRVEKPVFSPPVVTWVLIAVNLAIFLWMRRDGPEGFQRAIFEYAAIPRNVVATDVTVLMAGAEPVAAITPEADRLAYGDTDVDALRLLDDRGTPRWFYYVTPYQRVPLDVVPPKVPAWVTLLTSMFMHAGWMHILGNMWFLFLFGASVEDTLGKLTFLGFYLLSGLGAAAAQLAHDPHSVIPFLGASGAIAGVMGAFAVRFPGAQILTLIPIVLWTVSHIPAWIFMLIYIGEQIFMSIAHRADNGGVAWWAHIGGFAAGYVLIRWFPVSRAWKDVFSRSRHHPFS
jgi:membrane associated rhomboid family serine protease